MDTTNKPAEFGSQAGIDNCADRGGAVSSDRLPVATWVKWGTWKRLKASAREKPMKNLLLLEDEVTAMTRAIANRAEGQRVATYAEAQCRALTIRTMTRTRTRVSLLPTVDIICSFLDFVRQTGPMEEDRIFKAASAFIEWSVQRESEIRAGM